MSGGQIEKRNYSSEKQVDDQDRRDHDTLLDNSLPLPELPLGVSGAIVALVGIVCFVNSYSATFAFDDSEAIINNKDVHGVTNLSDLFLHDFWGSKLNSTHSHKSYRPLTVLTFRFNYWFSGGLYPLSFHLVNIVLHGVVSALFLIYFSILLSDGSTCLRQKKTSMLCSLLFAVHPIHTENVSAVVGRADLMCCLCFVLAFISYAKAVNTDSSESSASIKYLLFALVPPLVISSVLFKEQGITVLGICSAYDVVMVNRIHPLFIFKYLRAGSLFSANSSSSNNGGRLRGSFSSRIREMIIRQVLIIAFGLMILVARWWVMGSEPPQFHPVDNPQSFIDNTFYRILNYNYLYALNAWLLVNPWWLCFDWSMGSVPLIDSLTDLRLLSVVCFLLVFSFVVAAALKGPSPEQRRLVMSFAVMILTFLPASNILFRVGFVVAERNLYLPSVGFVLIVVLGFRRICRRNRSVFVGFVLLFLVYLSRSVQRSSQWLNEKALFESGVRVCPLNAKIHYNIAKLYADDGNADLAIKKYQRALELNPEYDQAMNNLGNLYKDRGQLQEAEELLQKAVDIRSDFSAAWMNLGIVQASLKKFRSAEMSYLTAIKHRRNYPDCYYNLGNLYLDENRHQEALFAWRNATLLRPTHMSAWTNLILLLDNLGRMKDLETVVSVALAHNPDESSIHYNFASALGRANMFEESERRFLLAIEMSSGVASYHSNLGVLYHRWGKLDLAEKQYRIAVALDNANRQTHDNLQLLLKKLGRSS